MKDAVGLYASTLGKKYLMAVTGIILFLYLVGHMLGNLQIFIGQEQIDRYARLLHANAAFLWGVRLVLLFCLAVHVVAAFQVWVRSRRARPVRYKIFSPPGVDYAARTMVWSGPIIFAFIVYHLLHLTAGTAHPDYVHLSPYHNVIVGFENTPAAVAYIVALLLLGFHLYHGLWSLFQSLGVDHPRYRTLRRPLAVVVTVVIVAGFLAVPLAVLTGVLHL
jgi:succinate dehydrogenase / fumarate reductase cytochrome b subunit